MLIFFPVSETSRSGILLSHSETSRSGIFKHFFPYIGDLSLRLLKNSSVKPQRPLALILFLAKRFTFLARHLFNATLLKFPLTLPISLIASNKIVMFTTNFPSTWPYNQPPFFPIRTSIIRFFFSSSTNFYNPINHINTYIYGATTAPLS